jgi:transglutaminase-like putative cysteine protease
MTMRLARDVAKLGRMRSGASLDSRNPEVRKKAVELTRKFRPDDWSNQARALHRWVRDHIRYVHDPDGFEELAPAPVVLERGFDDCDGKVKLVVAMAKALGLDADFQPVWVGPSLGHVQWRVRFPGSTQNHGADEAGYLVGDVTVKGAELGQDPRTVPRNPSTGRYPLS